jgi:uncharacterized protein (DUF305 family)
MRARLLVALIGLVVLVSGCSMMGDTAATKAGANETDIKFLRDMLPHHQQTMEISGLIKGRSTTPNLVKIADAMAAEGSTEIDKMNGWLGEWKTGVSDSGHQAHEMVVSPKDVALLGSFTGPEFDKQWSALLARHLRDGVKMAESQTSAGSHAGVKALAKGMIDAQTSIISDLERAGGV